MAITAIYSGAYESIWCPISIGDTRYTVTSQQKNLIIFPLHLERRSVDHGQKQRAREATTGAAVPSEEGKTPHSKRERGVSMNPLVLFLPRTFVQIQWSFVGNCLCLLFFTRSDCFQHKRYGQCWQDQHNYVNDKIFYESPQTTRRAQYTLQEYHRYKVRAGQCPKYPCYPTQYCLNPVVHLCLLLPCFMAILYNNEKGANRPNTRQVAVTHLVTLVLIGDQINTKPCNYGRIEKVFDAPL